jgi:hypothetical protein
VVSKREIEKDTVQELTVSAVDTVGRIAGILVNTVREVANEIGGFATNMYEIREASRRAKDDNLRD